ncbi:MAG: ATP-binding cassette domain-containing protein [Bacteroidales bacterium]|nr:ATP-binding cassette domain-containing protein [Bacteroidales bacterium]
MKHYLEVDSVILAFGERRILQDVFLKNETGQITGILGRNGSGKTCLLNIIYGELKTADKSVRIDDTTIFEGYKDPQILRYLPQFNFIPKNLRIKRICKEFSLDFAQFTAYFPSFEKYYNSPLKNLSGGECRIVEIYTILASKTKFCLLDEPFSQIMPVHIQTIKSIINKEKQNKGIIITDHLYNHVLDICDNIYLIADGKTHLTKSKDDLVRLGYIRENQLVK